jgi:hypothetical protein
MNPTQQFGFAWVALGAAIALHVTDEALTGFLSVYNPAVLSIRKRVPFLPLPTFTFGVWLGGLCLGILLLFALSPLAFHGSRAVILVSYPLAVLMFGNGLAHIASSLFVKRLMPGFYSSPVLLFVSAFLFHSARALG